mgnify:CR=1 FL=1
MRRWAGCAPTTTEYPAGPLTFDIKNKELQLEAMKAKDNAAIGQLLSLEGRVAVVTAGTVGQVAGMDIYQWNQIPTNGQNLAGVALGPDSLLVATGIPMAEIAGFNASVSTERP